MADCLHISAREGRKVPTIRPGLECPPPPKSGPPMSVQKPPSRVIQAQGFRIHSPMPGRGAWHAWFTIPGEWRLGALGTLGVPSWRHRRHALLDRLTVAVQRSSVPQRGRAALLVSAGGVTCLLRRDGGSGIAVIARVGGKGSLRGAWAMGGLNGVDATITPSSPRPAPTSPTPNAAATTPTPVPKQKPRVKVRIPTLAHVGRDRHITMLLGRVGHGVGGGPSLWTAQGAVTMRRKKEGKAEEPRGRPQARPVCSTDGQHGQRSARRAVRVGSQCI